MTKFVNISKTQQPELVNIDYILRILPYGKLDYLDGTDSGMVFAPSIDAIPLYHSNALAEYGPNVQPFSPKLTTIVLKGVSTPTTIQLPFTELIRRMREELLVL